MPSPFPGMDPYLEAPPTFSDLHGSLIGRIRAALNALLPPRYVARVDRYVWVDEPAADEQRLLGEPDIFLTDLTSGPSQVATLPAPATARFTEVRRQGRRYIRLVDATRHRVVTVIEILSPSNKDRGDDREAYLAKRREYLGAGVNLVEIDGRSAVAHGTARAAARGLLCPRLQGG